MLSLEGVATLDPTPLGEAETATYVDKYLETIRELGMTPEEALAPLTAVIRVTPTRIRDY